MIKHPAKILALLTMLNLLNYLDRLVVSAVLPKLSADLSLSKLEGGALATIFLVGYFVTSPIFGTLGDRGNRKGLIAVGVAVWSIATIATGFATGRWSLFAARAVVGIGEASYATIAPTIIDDIAPVDKKGRWLAVFYSASPIGSALGYFVGGGVEHAFGWRAAFFVAGGPGLLLAALCLLMAEPARQGVSKRESVFEAAKALLPLRLYRRGVLGYAAYTFAIGAFAYWAPTYLYERYKLALSDANLRFGAITVIAGAIGTAVGGWWGDRAAKKDRGEADESRNAALGYLRVCAISLAVGAPLALAAILSPTAPAFFFWVFIAELALFTSTSPINSVILRSVPIERRASAMALSILAIHLLGDLWSPALIGLIADHAPMELAMLMLPVAFAVGAGIWWMPKPRAPELVGSSS